MLTWFWVDEAHLTVEWGRHWREAYRHIGRMRDRLPGRIAWGAWSATIAAGKERDAVLETLGFQTGQYFEAHLSINRPEIQFLSRTLEYSISGDTFMDVNYLVPVGAASVMEIPGGVMCFCETIDQTTRLIRYLDGLIPEEWSGRESAVMPLHSLMSPESRKDTLRRFKDRSVRIILSTNCGCVGINLRIDMVVLISMVTSFALLMQWVGRAGRFPGAQAKGICYAPPWITEATEEELKTMKAGTLAEREEKRKKLEPVTGDFWNPNSTRCSRRVACEHYGDIYIRQEERCCGYHDKRIDQLRRLENTRRLRLMDKPAPIPRLPRSDGSHHPLDAETKPIAVKQLESWRNTTWPSLSDYSPHLPCAIFLPDFLINQLATKMHVIVSRDIFNQVMIKWEYLPDCGDVLFQATGTIIKLCDDITESRKSAERAQKTIKAKAARPRRGKNGPSSSTPATDDQEFPATPQRQRTFAGDASGRIHSSAAMRTPSPGLSPNKKRQKRENVPVRSQRRELPPLSPPPQVSESYRSSRGRMTKPQVRTEA